MKALSCFPLLAINNPATFQPLPTHLPPHNEESFSSGYQYKHTPKKEKEKKVLLLRHKLKE